ncbi:uncharacterized protein LOC129742220 [Uranotaenia lowii]|uniref:uncharacterized protein LOC129742220 n=1 Tax=Uranotaenia lowii TaxID=190385 RepID=UPI002478EDF8|nr:uncharacterized protein LOC129742220 [Uranotaenia lowii]
MVVLKSSIGDIKERGEGVTENDVVDDGKDGREREVDSESSGEEMDTSQPEKLEERLGKRPLIAEKSTSDTEGDARGRRTIERSRKKLHKAGGADPINALEIIAKKSQERGGKLRERSGANNRSRSRVDDGNKSVK